MSGGDRRLDPRAWLVWWFAASLPALLGRNPVPLLTVLVAIVLVRMLVQPGVRIISPGIMRLFLVLAIISVVFNALTVHAGDIVLFDLPDWLPLVGGEMTLNAVVYGLLSAVAILSLVLAGLTVAEQLDWSQLMRLLPESLLGLGAAGSIALAFFPQMLASFRQIREARLIRGAPLASPRDYASVVAPMLASGLDRAVILSEMLEVRSFGGVSAGSRTRSRAPLVMAGAAALMVIGCYLFFTDQTGAAMLAGGTGAAVSAAVLLSGRSRPSTRTRYRPAVWTSDDTIVAVASLVAMAGTLWTLTSFPEALRYEPYPEMTWPSVSVPLVVALCGLVAPAVVSLRWESEHV